MQNNSIFSFFKKRSFVILSFGGLVSIIGDLMQDFALSLYTLKITGSSIKFASVIIISIIPYLIISPISGVIVDKFDRKKLIVLVDIFRCIFIFLFYILFLKNNGVSLIQIYIFIIILEISTIFYSPAQKTILPNIVSKNDLVKATSLYTSITQTACLIAPVLGGIVYGIWGMASILIINSISFFISAFSKFFLKIPSFKSSYNILSFTSLKKQFKEGLQFFKLNKTINTLTISMFILTLGITSCTSIGYIYLSKKILMVSDYKYGILGTFDVIGGLLGAFLLPSLRKKKNLKYIIFKSMLFSSIAYIVLAAISCSTFTNLISRNTTYYIILIIIALIALFATLTNISVQIEFQNSTDNRLQGRIFTIFEMFTNISALISQIVFGFLYDILNTPICIFISALLLFLGFTYCYSRLNKNHVIKNNVSS
ncbi:MFS transporter [Clostridium felsineum]|uniref:MFS transporter n=1 Tax=Clostridium felsineum TaxID=36839 RepID=UPI00098BFE21|nr:MFS transporter [Clostridium felsineum]URZ04640.1 Enterobactin exporter EntS [Clostridium felsineum]